MMKWAAWVIGILMVVLAVFMALQYLASERVEVVVLHSVDTDGQKVETRLWVVDHEGSAYLRVGEDGSGWYSRIVANPVVELERNGITTPYQVVPRPDLSNTINDLMQAKYTWGDSFIAYALGGRENSIPLQLTPVKQEQK